MTMLFADLTETEAITLYTMLESGNRHAYSVAFSRDYRHHRPYIDLTLEAAQLMGQLAGELSSAPGGSDYLWNLIFKNKR